MNYEDKLAASVERYHARMKELRQKRPSTKLITHMQSQPQLQAQTQATVETAKCTAHTLEGRKCAFKATHGSFCRKHFLIK